MTVRSVVKDTETLTMVITAEFEAPVARVWQLWDDPRQLERWWGPPSYPATVIDHGLRAGGGVSYHMTGPDGDRHGGWWQVTAVEPPHRLQFVDGFADDDGQPDLNLPAVDVAVQLDELAVGTTLMSITTVFPSLEAMEQMVEMGMEEGMAQALDQIDEILLTGAVS